VPDTGFLLGLLQELERKQTLKQRENPSERFLVNYWRERECVSCLKLGYRGIERKPSEF